jgi:hypothetical protein
LERKSVDALVEEIRAIYGLLEVERKEQKDENGTSIGSVKLEMSFPPFLDIPRILYRTFLTGSVDKIVNFNTFDIILPKIIISQLHQRYGIRIIDGNDKIEGTNSASCHPPLIIRIDLTMNREESIYSILSSSFKNVTKKTNKKKRKIDEINSLSSSFSCQDSGNTSYLFLIHSLFFYLLSCRNSTKGNQRRV